ncbi:MAG: LysM peptidoglycan-binding domain-containing protein [Anaerolineales bacterium]|nr:LysM peptidoglycan-binding domain-containing protein [Anaerolineales bacterium]
MLDPNAVRPGLIIIVPLNLCGATPTPRPPDPNPNPSPNPNTGIYDRGAQKYANGTLVGNVYTVLWGDTQGGIARRFGITLAQLQQANGITQGIPIKPGNRLIIPGMGGGAGTPTPTPVIGCEIAALQLIYAYVQPNFSAQIFTPIVSGAKIRPLTRQGNWFAFSKAIYQTGSTDLLWIYTAPGLVTFAGNCNF